MMDYIFFLPDVFGGVSNVVAQYTNHLSKSNNINSIKVVLTSLKEGTVKNKLLDSDFSSTVSLERFTYSKYDNRFSVYKRLSRLVLNNKAVIICNDFLELYMLANIQLLNPSVLILHGDYKYYYDLANVARGFVTHFFAVNPIINKKLKIEIPEASVSTLRFLVDNNYIQEGKFSEEIFKVIFIGRVSHAKGFDVLENVFNGLQKENMQVHFTIIGALTDEEYNAFLIHPKITYFERLKNQELNQLLVNQHVLLLPSRAEGYPIAVVEAMKAGVLPIVNDIPPIASDILLHRESGLRIQENNVEDYISEIVKLNQNRMLLKSLSESAFNKVNLCFDNKSNFIEFESIIEGILQNQQTKVFPDGIGRSSLDMPFIPNILTHSCRRFMNFFKKWKVSH